MRRVLLLPALLAMTLSAQNTPVPDLTAMAEQLDQLIAKGDWETAAQLSRKLKLAVTEARNESVRGTSAELIQSMLTWLPPDTETVLVAAQPFRVPNDSRREDPDTLRVALLYALGPAGNTPRNIRETLEMSTIRLAVLGGRNFGMAPSDSQSERGGLGMIPYEGCSLILFSGPLPDSITAKPSDDTIVGHRVWVTRAEAPIETNRANTILTVLRPDLLAACNSRAYFEQTMLRVDSSPKDRALPLSLPEWKLLSGNSPVWGLTHYGPKSAIPMFWTRGVTDSGSLPSGAVVEFGQGGGGIRAVLLAGNDPWKNLVNIPDLQGSATSSEITRGVWELQVKGKLLASSTATFALMSILGFIVFL